MLTMSIGSKIFQRHSALAEKMQLFLKGYYNTQSCLPVPTNVAKDASSLADKCINTDMSMKFRLDTKCQLA